MVESKRKTPSSISLHFLIRLFCLSSMVATHTVEACLDNSLLWYETWRKKHSDTYGCERAVDEYDLLLRIRKFQHLMQSSVETLHLSTLLPAPILNCTMCMRIREGPLDRNMMCSSCSSEDSEDTLAENCLLMDSMSAMLKLRKIE
jgi:hypothetical protein